MVNIDNYNNDTWIKVFEGLEHIYRTKEMSTMLYGELYTAVYNYCTNTQSQSSGSTKFGKSTKINQIRNLDDAANAVDEELYFELKNYLE
ncbi:unnamed protein product [Rotaria sp. Silwood1]|nr:unnamed protein product [Rotaria sp. Silwood1]CAF1639646.1 unnamed protein product [Rotaria sp. Silwood1]CAF3966536.1 unnamed protein product [Rotaria sp. Silwood1]CAF4995288.1 unnamed protein product [Rotaria sp. Silwood1]